MSVTATAQILGPIQIQPPVVTKVPQPQAPVCEELNLAKGRYVVLDRDVGFEIVVPPAAQPGYCAADEVFVSEYVWGFSTVVRQRGPLQCPAEHFVSARLGEFICGFVKRQNESTISLADRIDALSTRLEAAEKKLSNHSSPSGASR